RKHCFWSAKKNENIIPNILFFCIGCIHLCSLVKWNFISSRGLPGTSYARLYRENVFDERSRLGIFLLLLFQLTLYVCPGTNHTHLSMQHIEKLRELINRQGS